MAIADLLAKLVELKSQLVANLSSMDVTADENEKLNTLVPKVLECKTEQNVEWVDSPSGTSTFRNICKNVNIPYGITYINQEFRNDGSKPNTTIENIYYKGTEEQWNAITKGDDWNSDMGSYNEGGTVITYNYTG